MLSGSFEISTVKLQKFELLHRYYTHWSEALCDPVQLIQIGWLILDLGEGVVTVTHEYTAKYLLSRTEEFAIYNPPESAPSYFLNFSMLLREEDTALCNRISEVIESMKSDGTLDTLKTQYIDEVIAGAEPEAIVPETFDSAQTLRVALTGDRPPMDYFSDAGKPMGFNTALVSEIGKRLGMNVEFISIDTAVRAIALSSEITDVVFWMEAGDFGNWAMADVEDQPESTMATSPFLKGAFTHVVSASSDLLKEN